MKTGVFLILMAGIISILFITGCSQSEKKEIGQNVTNCKRICNQTYIDSQGQLEACWNSCRSFGTNGNAYNKYLDNLTEIKNEETK